MAVRPAPKECGKYWTKTKMITAQYTVEYQPIALKVTWLTGAAPAQRHDTVVYHVVTIRNWK